MPDRQRVIRIHHVIFPTMLVGILVMLGTCEKRSEWTNMRFSVEASVDGHPIRASTIWRTRFIEGFPQGGITPVSGYALAIPLDPKTNVYGIFRSINNNMIMHWGVLATGLDAYVMNEDQNLRRPSVYPKSRARFRNYAVTRLVDRDIQFCLAKGSGLAGQDRCPIFVYYSEPDDPNSLRMIKPGEITQINGHQLSIEKVSFTFTLKGVYSINPDRHLPSFVSNDHSRAGKLPEGLVTDNARQLYGSDFVKDEK